LAGIGLILWQMVVHGIHEYDISASPAAPRAPRLRAHCNALHAVRRAG
jgi:hypothetical protein